MDALHEEVCGNRLVLAGRTVDAYLQELGNAMKKKLSHSKATGLASPIVLFLPWTIFQHVVTLATGYGAEISTSGRGKSSRITVDVNTRKTACKLFSPARLSGETYLRKRNFTKGLDGKYLYTGKSVIAITKSTPLRMEYRMSSRRVALSVYIQRYDKHDFVLDNQLQKIMNRN